LLQYVLCILRNRGDQARIFLRRGLRRSVQPGSDSIWRKLAVGFIAMVPSFLCKGTVLLRGHLPQSIDYRKGKEEWSDFSRLWTNEICNLGTVSAISANHEISTWVGKMHDFNPIALERIWYWVWIPAAVNSIRVTPSQPKYFFVSLEIIL
jgi:hypothetical protein